MYNVPVRIGLILMFLILFFSCSKDSRLPNFLKKLESNIGNEIVIEAIKQSNKDSLIFILPVFRVEYLRLTQKLDNKDKISDLIKSNLTEPFFASNEEILLFAFHRYLNQQKLDLEQIQVEIQQTRTAHKEKMKREKEFHEKELINLIKANNSKWNIGDTLSIILDIDSGSNVISYKPFPLTLDYSNAEDTLKIKGILIDKFNSQNLLKGNSQKLEDLMDLYFKLKVLELNREYVMQGLNKVEIGSDFRLYLESYGRPIE